MGLRSRPGVSKRASAAGTKCHHRHRTGEARRVLQPAASDREAGHLPSTWPRHAERLSGSPDRPDRAHFEWQSAPAAACRPRGGVRQPGLFAGSPDLDCSRRAKPSLLGGSLLFRGGPADPAWAGSAPRQLRRARATTDVCRLGGRRRAGQPAARGGRRRVGGGDAAGALDQPVSDAAPHAAGVRGRGHRRRQLFTSREHQRSGRDRDARLGVQPDGRGRRAGTEGPARFSGQCLARAQDAPHQPDRVQPGSGRWQLAE